jgi:hypothetical protein
MDYMVLLQNEMMLHQFLYFGCFSETRFKMKLL